jgi:hypothetical protein
MYTAPRQPKPLPRSHSIDVVAEITLMAKWTRRGFVGSLSGIAGATMFGGKPSAAAINPPEAAKASGPIMITDLKCENPEKKPQISPSRAWWEPPASAGGSNASALRKRVGL